MLHVNQPEQIGEHGTPKKRPDEMTQQHLLFMSHTCLIYTHLLKQALHKLKNLFAYVLLQVITLEHFGIHQYLCDDLHPNIARGLLKPHFVNNVIVDHGQQYSIIILETSAARLAQDPNEFYKRFHRLAPSF